MTLAKKGAVVWFTGLSGAGKTTVADGVHAYIQNKGVVSDRLDGDDIRKNLNEQLGFSEEGRKRNIEIASFVSDRMASHGVIVLSSFISPYRQQRNEMRERIDNFIEVYVAAPLAICEERDSKGLYKKARAGEIKNFTGVDDPYEEPDKPDVVLHTHEETEAESINKVVKYLETNGYI